MKGRQIALDHLKGREVAALMVDGKLEDLLVAGDAPPPGTIYRARTDRPVKGQGGMFLTTPDGPAFLRQVKGLAPGQTILVQVSGYAEPGKAIPVTARLLFKSRYAIITPDAPGLNISRRIRDEDERDRLLELAHTGEIGDETGLILRSSCNMASGDEIADDISAMSDLCKQVVMDGDTTVEKLLDGDSPHQLAWREWVEPAQIDADAGSLERHGALDAIDRSLTPHEPLPGGGHLYIEPTRALVAVDVNSGRDTSLASGTKANIACARVLPRALRVRGLGGQVTLDPSPMPKKDRRGFETALRAAFRADTVDTVIAGWTPLGKFELQRQRSRLPLREALA